MLSEDVDDEIVLPGLVGLGNEARQGPGVPLRRIQLGVGLESSNTNQEEEIASDDEELADLVETVSERLMGLTEMLPDRFWRVFNKTRIFSYWLVRRSAWVLGTSMTLLVLAPFLEQQRLDMEEMQNMQKKQMLLGPSQSIGPKYPR